MRRRTQRQREVRHVRRKADIRGVLPQVKEGLGLPGAGRCKERSSPRGFGERRVLLTP